MVRAAFVSLVVLASASAYIAVDGRRLTLGEVMLEFPHVALMEVDRADPERGAFLLKLATAYQGKPGAVPTKLALFERGKLPAALAGLKPGARLVVFAGSPDNRSLVRAGTMWIITKPEGGWERLNAVRPDLNAIFSGTTDELADAVLRLRTGRVAEVKAGGATVRYDPEQPHRRFVDRPIGGTVAALTKALKDADRFVCAEAALALIAHGKDAHAALPELEAALAERDWEHDYRPHRAAAAAEAILRLAPKSSQASAALRLLTGDKMLTDRRIDAEGTREAAARALARCGEGARPALPLLEKALKDELPGVRIAAAEAVWRLGGQDKARPVLAKELKSADVAVRIRAARACHALGLKEMTAALADDPNEHVRAAFSEGRR